jgi:hypothetical protein
LEAFFHQTEANLALGSPGVFALQIGVIADDLMGLKSPGRTHVEEIKEQITGQSGCEPGDKFVCLWHVGSDYALSLKSATNLCVKQLLHLKSCAKLAS